MASANSTTMTIRGTVLGQGKLVDLTVDGGKVSAMVPATRGPVDLGSRMAIIAPTLCDIQVNGAAGANLQGPKVSAEDVRRVNKWMAAHGVSCWVPTVITGSQKQMERSCRAIAEALEDRTLARHVPGIHLEGPYISPEDGPRGAHPKRHVRKPNLREFNRLHEAAGGRILYVTVAPEVDGAIAFIRSLAEMRITVSLGHHNSDAEQIARAVDAGARLCTHLGNGMAPQVQRHFNPIWPQLAEDRLTASLIADLHHLPEPVLKTFIRAKTPERVVLTSDVVHIAGLPPGNYDLAGQPVQLTPSGRINLNGTELLAGSALPLLPGVVNAARVAGLTLEQAYACATTQPAKLLGLKRRFVSPEVGKRADFVVFDIDTAHADWAVRIHGAFVNGVFRAPEQHSGA